MSTPDRPALHGTAPASTYRQSQQREVVQRLRRIQGQVRAIEQMIEDGRSCEDIAQQMAAARRAMDKVFFRMMACSVMECVASADAEPRADVANVTRILEKYA
jgi:DNA-binding FrmR family transcriptional regulator